jgi:membrane-associated phospholipid phosphatase
MSARIPSDATDSFSAFFPRGVRRWHLVAAAFACIALAWIFAAIAEDVATTDYITQVDQRVATALHAAATPLFTRAMLAISWLHAVVPLAIATLALLMFLLWRRQRIWIIALLLALPGGMLVNALMKFAFSRPRPHFDDPLVVLTSYSFPSGHTAGSTLLYGFIAALLISRTRSNGLRVMIAVAALLMIATVASSRIYLGAHFLSDVLAAFFEALAWLVLCGIAAQLLSAHWSKRQAALNHESHTQR